MSLIERGFQYAKERYAALGVDVEAALSTLNTLPISVHCWQGDDVLGFDNSDSLSGGIATTGNYPGRARTPQELRADLSKAFSLIPGAKKLNLHAMYAEGNQVERDQITVSQFENWIAWAQEQGVGLDFNPSFFSHPMVKDGFTLASPDASVRSYWIEHGKRCREIGAAFAKRSGQPCVVNYWMPDGYKDVPVDTAAPRARMVEALDEIFAQPQNTALVKEAVESKLFGLGVESYTVGSHELMYGYAITRNKLYCLDAGHFHPTEIIGAKISACLRYCPELLLHVSRGVRWDSDHVILMDNELEAIMQEVVRGDNLGRVYIALDYFDASINRIAAWVIGVRNAKKALLKALLEPTHLLRQAEEAGDYASRLALLEETRTLPFAAVWDAYLDRCDIPGMNFMQEIKAYEKDVLSKRG